MSKQLIADEQERKNYQLCSLSRITECPTFDFEVHSGRLTGIRKGLDLESHQSIDADQVHFEWSSQSRSSPMLIVDPPFFLVATNIICWWCGDDITVVGIVARDVMESEGGEEYRPSCDTDDFFSLTNIESLPAGLLAEIQAHSPTFGKAIPFTAKPTYFANYCAYCNALQGDHYVHSEPDQGFFPTDEADCVDIQVRTLNYADRFRTTACVASSTPIQRVLHRHLGLPCQ